MNTAPAETCPLCCHQVLRHVRGRDAYWLCRRCREEFPGSMVQQPKLIDMTRNKSLNTQMGDKPIRFFSFGLQLFSFALTTPYTRSADAHGETPHAISAVVTESLESRCKN